MKRRNCQAYLDIVITCVWMWRSERGTIQEIYGKVIYYQGNSISGKSLTNYHSSRPPAQRNLQVTKLIYSFGTLKSHGISPCTYVGLADDGCGRTQHWTSSTLTEHRRHRRRRRPHPCTSSTSWAGRRRLSPRSSQAPSDSPTPKTVSDPWKFSADVGNKYIQTHNLVDCILLNLIWVFRYLPNFGRAVSQATCQKSSLQAEWYAIYRGEASTRQSAWCHKIQHKLSNRLQVEINSLGTCLQLCFSPFPLLNPAAQRCISHFWTYFSNIA